MARPDGLQQVEQWHFWLGGHIRGHIEHLPGYARLAWRWATFPEDGEGLCDYVASFEQAQAAVEQALGQEVQDG